MFEKKNHTNAVGLTESTGDELGCVVLVGVAVGARRSEGVEARLLEEVAWVEAGADRVGAGADRYSAGGAGGIRAGEGWGTCKDHMQN